MGRSTPLDGIPRATGRKAEALGIDAWIWDREVCKKSRAAIQVASSLEAAGRSSRQERKISEMEPRSPVIVIGMHRSGTTMITKMLEGLGVFLGWRKQGDHEATFFLGLNDWLLDQCRCGWDNPAPFRYLLEDPPMRSAALEYLKLSLESPRSVSFLGVRRYLETRTPLRLTEPWGFKDPRSTFTLPLWLELFPDARLIHVSRHGVDVAASLTTRHDQIVAARKARFDRHRWIYRLRARRSRIATSARCASLAEGFALWEEYLDESHRQIDAHSGESLDVRYEDFLASPAEGLARAARFCGLKVTDELVAEVAGDAQLDRAYAHRRSPELVEFAAERAESLSIRGY
jgi:Sulfotransferase family